MDMTFFTSFSKASRRAVDLGIRILPASPYCKRVVVRDIIFLFFLQKAEQDVSRKPEGKHLLLEWRGRPGERRQTSVSCQNKGWTCAWQRKNDDHFRSLPADHALQKEHPFAILTFGECQNISGVARRTYFSQQAPMPQSQECTYRV